MRPRDAFKKRLLHSKLRSKRALTSLNANPSAANKARDVLDVAENDLSRVAQSFERLREEEKAKLEQSLDEQTREYTPKLLELELQAQDKLENHESDFRAFFEEEKARFSKTCREKLEQYELRATSSMSGASLFRPQWHCHADHFPPTGRRKSSRKGSNSNVAGSARSRSAWKRSAAGASPNSTSSPQI